MSTHSSRFRAFAVVFVSLAFLAVGSGCGKEAEQAPLSGPIQKRDAPKPDEQSALLDNEHNVEQPSAAANPSYDSEGKRDPFVSFSSGGEELASEDQSPLLPLQRYELGELKMSGVIWGSKGPKALVEDAKGEGFTVEVGERIGRSGGVVIRITETEIVVREEFPGVGGRKVARESTLQLTSVGGI